MNLSRKKAGFLAAIAIVVIFAFFSAAKSYSVKDLSRHFRVDLYQSLADSFRAGELSLLEDGRRKTSVDVTPRGRKIYLSWGPAPAAIYALFDALFELLGFGLFPKVPLFFCLLAAHVVSIFLILNLLMDGKIAVPLLLVGFYCFSFPFWNFINSEIEIYEISSMYASAFFLLGVSCYMRSWKVSSTAVAALSAIFLSCAMLSRPTYFIWVFILSIFIIFSGKKRKNSVLFCSIVIIGGTIFLIYNHLRFGNLFNFGEKFKFHSVWEEYIFDLGIIPFSLKRTLARFQEAFYWYLGINIGHIKNQQIGFSPINTLYATYGDNLFLLKRLSILNVGLVYGLFWWIRIIRKHQRELTLLVGVTCIIFFYLFYQQSCELRYSMDIWPVLFILSGKGIYDFSNVISRKNEKNYSTFVCFLIISLAFALNVVNGEALNNRPDISNEPMPFWEFEPVNTDCSLKCTLITPVYESFEDIHSWKEQEFLFMLGIYRFIGDECYMLFFSGATLEVQPSKECRVELLLHRPDIEDCERITFYLDGYPQGSLTETYVDNANQRLCTYMLPPTGLELISAYFLFEPVDFEVYDLRRQTKHYRMYQLNMNCDITIPDTVGSPDGSAG